MIGNGYTFGGYSEGLPSVGYVGPDVGDYVRKHSPWVSFTNVPSSTNLPFSSFPTDYSQLPTVSFVTPNVTNDMHDGTIAQADTWLQTNLGGYVQWAQTHNSLLIVTWDEDDLGATNQIPTIFAGPMITSGSYSELIDHYNVLSTVEDMYGLPYLGQDATATSINDIYTGTYTGTVHFTSSDTQAALPADYTFTAADNGTHTFSATLKTAGSQSLVATDTVTGTIAGNQSVTVQPAVASSLLVTDFPSPIQAGMAGNFSVTALDAFGNTATDYQGTIHVTSTDGQEALPGDYNNDGGVDAADFVVWRKGLGTNYTQTDYGAWQSHFGSSKVPATLPADYTFTGGDSGTHAFSATLNTPGSQLLSATDIATGSITGSQIITVQPLPPASDTAQAAQPASGFTQAALEAPDTTQPAISGDFNNDGTVDSADYILWRKSVGTAYAQTDYDTWRSQFGDTLSSQSLVATAAATGLTSSATHFAVIGDFGADSTAEGEVAALVKSWSPDYILTVGDDNYDTGSASTIDANIGKYYHDYIAPYVGNYGAGSATNRFFPSLGNHDWGNVDNNPQGDQPYLNYFTLPGNERYYTFTEGPIQFFALDSDANEPDGITSTSAQAVWLQQQLAASTATYKIVYFHHPAYSSSSGKEEEEMRWPFQAWGATAVLTGHAHNYERLIEDNNFPYFVDGLGGEEDILTFDTPIPGSQIRYNADFGAMLVTADQTQMQFQFITVTGQVIDTYTIPAPQPHVSTTLVPLGSVWKYLDNGTNQGTAWQAASFNDSAWKSGPAQLGYGDGDEQTVVGYGPDSSNKYITTYFRTSFVVSDPSVAANGLSLSLLRDDGAVVYLNGVEVFRSNMPTGTVSYLTTASSAVAGTDESALFTATINPALLIAGTNVLAVEIHQSDGASSDISFDFSLIGTRTSTPGVVSSLRLAGFPSPAQAGVAGNFTATAVDGTGATVTGYRGTIHFTTSDMQAGLPADYTFTAADNGTHTFSATLKTAGTQSLVATDTATGTIAGSQSVTVQPAVASSLRVAGFPTSVQTGVAGNFTVTAVDPYGNTANSYRGTIHFTSSDSQAVLPANYTFTAADNGIHTFSATLKTAGSQALIATDTVTSTIAGSQTVTVQSAPVNTTLVAAGSVWKYLDNGTNQGTAWQAASFNDSAWKSGPAQLGYGDGDEQTVVGYGSNSSNKYITTYFRTSFVVSDPSVAANGLSLSLLRDDGAVVYLNGVEVFRSNMPTGTIGYQTQASSAVTGTDESTWYPATINPALLIAGTNVLAVEIHQSDGASSDISFDFSLIGTRTSTPGVVSSLRLAGFPSPAQAGVAGNFTATAVDGTGATVTGYRGTIHFTTSDMQAGLPADYTFTAADNGTHTFSATLKTAGTQSLVATDTATGTIAGSQSVTVQPAVASSLRVAGFPTSVQTGVAGNFTVTAVDPYGNTANSYRGTIHFTSSDSQAVLPANYTFTAADNGIHTFSATLKTAGSQALIATDTVTSTIAGSQTVTVQSAPVNTTLVAAGSVWKYLDNGTNQGTAWQAASFNDSAWKSGPAQLGYGDGDEQTVVGYGSNSSNKYITTYFRTSFVVSDPSVAANGLSLSLLRDDGAVVYLNGVEVFRSNMPTGTIGYQTQASSAVTGTDESTWYPATINPALLIAGTNVLAVEIHQSDGASSDISFDFSLIGTRTSTPGVVSSLRLAGFPSPAQAGVAGNFTATAVDGTGATVTGYRGTIHFTTSDMQAGLPADYTFTAADNGTHTFSATLKTAGTQSLVATDTATGTIAGSQSVTVQPAVASSLRVAGFPTSVQTGVAGNFTVTAVDPYGNTANSYRGTIHFTSSDSQAVLPANYTFTAADNGTHTFSATMKTLGSQTLVATDTVTNTVAGSETVTVQSAVANSLRLAGFPSPAQAGVAGNFTATAVDGTGATVTGYRGTIHFTTSDMQAGLPADYTFTAADNGTHTFSATLKTAGTQSLVATDTATGTIAGSQSVTVQPAVASSLRVAGFPTSVQTGVAGNFTVTAVDPYGNTANSYRGTIHFTSSDSQAVLPANYTFTAADNGIHTFSATLKTAGSQALIATDTVTSTIAGSQTVTVQSAPVNTTLVAAGSVWKYLDNGTNQGTAWQAASFNDSAWKSGPAQLGYGDGDEQTVVGYGSDSSNKYITTYFRTSFVVSNPSVAANGLSLSLLRDDGAVVYLNGVEVFRSNMPTGTIGFQTVASSSVNDADESAWYPATINPALLVAGNNVLAVEIHQWDPTSTDISFDFSLVGSGTP